MTDQDNPGHFNKVSSMNTKPLSEQSQKRNLGKTHPKVIGRRWFHIAIIELEAKWMYRLQAIGALIGFLVVLLPTISSTWREIVVSFPPTRWIYDEFSLFGPFALTVLVIFIFATIALNSLYRHFPGGWDAKKEWGFPTARVIRDRALYPTRLLEEVVFWLATFIGLFGLFFWLYFPFGLIAFFIRKGSI